MDETGPKLRRRPPGSARVLHPELSPFLVEYKAKGEAAGVFQRHEREAHSDVNGPFEHHADL